MTSRERVLAAVTGQPVDRTPVMVWLNPHMTCRLTAEYRSGERWLPNFAATRLWRRFDRKGRTEAGEITRMLPLLLEAYGNSHYALDLGADIALLSPEFASPSGMLGGIRREDGKLRIDGPFGLVYGVGGIYAEVVEHPVDDARSLSRLELPPLKPSTFAGIRRFRRAHPDACIMVEAFSFQQVVRDFIMETSRYMMALYDEPKAIQAFHDRLADWIVEIIRRIADAGADLVFLQDDYGTGGRPLISMQMWKRFVYPYLVRFVDAAHEAGVPFVLHSCGYQMPFLEHYVAAGVDALQSFQPKAGNDLETAYAEYGDDLTFITGIDIQRGESMTPEALREEILHNVRIGRATDRFILGTTHMMQVTMPMSNVRAIFDTIREIQG
jgi:uroporphyrinogen-III decarboxylase